MKRPGSSRLPRRFAFHKFGLVHALVLYDGPATGATTYLGLATGFDVDASGRSFPKNTNRAAASQVDYWPSTPGTSRRRDLIERPVSWLKHPRRNATRLEKRAVNFPAVLKLAMIQRYLRNDLRATT
jgi:hypothetical protein